jgi:hypothetical protein
MEQPNVPTQKLVKRGMKRLLFLNSFFAVFRERSNNQIPRLEITAEEFFLTQMFGLEITVYKNNIEISLKGQA